jgi:glycogen operon protein
MISHGDELGRTQEGNNNGYCQDNEITWIDWDLSPADAAHLEFTKRLVHLRKDNNTLRRRRFFNGAAEHGGESEIGDIAWLTPAAEPMTSENWNHSYARSVMVFLNGDKIQEPDVRGAPIVDKSLLILLNADSNKLAFVVPPADYGPRWSVVLDTDERLKTGATYTAERKIILEAHSVVVLSRPSLEQ